MQDDAIPAAYNRRSDLQLMFRHGAVMSEESVLELFTDAMHRYVQDLSPDGTYRFVSSGSPPERETKEQLAATLAGAAATFANAARRLLQE